MMKFLLVLCLAIGAFATVIPEVTEKPGTCPTDIIVETGFGLSCVDECDHDNICLTETHKCCATTCGKRCMAPVAVFTEEEEEKTREEIKEMLTTILTERRELIQKLEKYPPPGVRFIGMKDRTNVVRMCVVTPCEMRKCQRIAQAMTYKVAPRKEWFCQLATSTKQCLFWAERGWTDVVVAREKNIFIAKEHFNVTAFAIEHNNMAPTEIERKIQNVTLAIVKTQSDIHNFHQLSGRKVCSAGIENAASFITPVCHLIDQGIIVPTGNAIETATDFFGDMCVPGVLKKMFDIDETYSHKLVNVCPNTEAIYSGLAGSVSCVANGHGDVAFVDSKVVRALNNMYPDSYQIVCSDGKRSLTEWEEAACHIGHTPRPVVFLNPERGIVYTAELRQILEEAAKIKSTVSNVDIFSSADYVCLGDNNKNLIFMDENTNLEFIDNGVQNIPMLVEYLRVLRTCRALVPKPRAKICTTSVTQYQNCITMKNVFQYDDQLKKMAWGCVLAKTEMDCMRNVLNGTADMYSADLKEIFIGGNDFKLQPIMIQDEKLRFENNLYYNTTIKSYTIAIMKKSKLWKKFGQDAKFVSIRDLTVCSPDMQKVANFHLPIGHLLSIGVIPRIGSVFESVSRFYKSVCLPGAAPSQFKWDSDLVLGHEVNWGIPGVNFYNFTGFNWFIWNSPHTWNFYNYNRKTPGNLKKFMQNRLLIPLLEGKLTVPEGFNPDTFDYSILDDVLSVEGLGDIISDIPDEIRDSLVDIRTRRVDRRERLGDLYEEKTGDEFISLRARRLGKLTLRGYMQQSFQNMEDEWGIFDDINTPLAGGSRSSITGGRVSNMRDRFDDMSESAGDNTIIGNLLQNYDNEYTVPSISRVFAKVLTERFDKLDSLASTLEILHRIPTMTSVNGEDYAWIKHPAVQSYLKIYAPRLISFYSDMYDNDELAKLQFSRYLKPLWLSPTFDDFLAVTKTHMAMLTKACRGYGEHQGVGSLQEPFFGDTGALRCIGDHEEGDIAFLDTESVQQIIQQSEYLMITPLGIIQSINAKNIVNGSFGTVPFPAILTSFNHTGSWRWQVTRAMLLAQKKFAINQTTAGYTMFGAHSVFMPKTKKLIPVELIKQNHAAYLGPKLSRAFEAIIKPSTHDWWKERRHICSGDTFTNIIAQHNGTCTAMIKDVTCMGMPRPKVMSVGTSENKQPVVVKMCSLPTRFIRQMAEFRCNNGHGYVTPVMIPTTCQCMPCEDVEYIPQWTTDEFWLTEGRKHIITEDLETIMPLWGNEEFWADHTLNHNFEIGIDMDIEGGVQVGPLPVIKPVGTCQGNWIGQWWNPEWYQGTNRPVCVGTMTGLRSVLRANRVQVQAGL